MTDRPTPDRPAERRPASPRPAPRARLAGMPGVAALSLAGFLAVLLLLAWQVRAGHDPALGAEAPGVATPDHVIVKRRIVRRVIVELPPAGAASAAAAATPAPDAPAPPAALGPAPAPAPAPAPTSAPGPAPAPAPPPTTGAS